MRTLTLLAFIGLLFTLPALVGAEPSASIDPPHHALYAPAPSALLAGDVDLRGPSQYLAGTIAVRVVLPESNGLVDPSSEDWNPEQIELVRSGVDAALEWWRQQLPLARLEFKVQYQVVPSSYEPTRHGLAGESLWIGDTLAKLGFRSGSYFDQAYEAAYSLRDELDADWATTIFVVNSDNGNGYLADGYFAYAYINGPFMVLTSDAGGYGSRHFAAVTAHEFGHIFGALDQYHVAQVDCTRTSGYLNAPTTNSQFNACGTNEPSIMLEPITAFAQQAVDPSALAQVGYRDSDIDGAIDPLDTTPALNLRGPQVSTVGVRPRLSGNTEDLAFPSPSQTPVSINWITGIEYRVNRGAWQYLPAADGMFDSASESFDRELPLYDGEHSIELRARNSAGMLSQTIVQQVAVAGIGPAPEYAVLAGSADTPGLLDVQFTAPAETQAVQVSSEPTFANANWEPFTPERTYDLYHGPGSVELYVRFRDGDGRESLVYRVEVASDSHTIYLPLLRK
ncbi:MAG: hypothetical protein HC822_19265 [Oscillochloris sp.]|nr:hypothetical protein [Oscillochloris sp.]